MSIQLIIVGPLEQEVYEVIWLEVDTPVGNFVIQPGHAPMFVTLNPEAPVTYSLKDGTVVSRQINGGILKIAPFEARIITI